MGQQKQLASVTDWCCRSLPFFPDLTLRGRETVAGAANIRIVGDRKESEKKHAGQT